MKHILRQSGQEGSCGVNLAWPGLASCCKHLLPQAWLWVGRGGGVAGGSRTAG